MNQELKLHIEKLRAKIESMIPMDLVLPRHTDREHFYEIQPEKGVKGPVYPSVTGKLQILKDEGLINYKMDRALEYVFANFKTFTDQNIVQEIDKASKVSGGILIDAGSVGTAIHDVREAIFKHWIKTGEKPEDFLSFIPPENPDTRIVSAIRALRRFVDERNYIPVACELFIYSHKLKVAGTLDDLGMMKETVIEPGDPDCNHEALMVTKGGLLERCLRPQCLGKWEWQFVLCDLKSSNQFKDHYFFQVALYNSMFTGLTGLRPKRCFILKVSKEDGSYKIEDLKEMRKLGDYCRAMIKVNEGIEFIRSLRKDNQRTVIKL